jgi:PAS domain S-box-containing protein
MADTLLQPAAPDVTDANGPKLPGSLAADIIIANAPDPVFVSDLEGKILQANDAVFALLGFRPDELIEQSLSRIISPEETREFMAALDEVVEHGVTRNAVLNPRSASGEIIPTTLNASALRDPDGKVIGAIGILRDMRAYEQVVRDLEESKAELQEKILDLEKFEEVVVGRELKMIALEKELEKLQREVEKRPTRACATRWRRWSCACGKARSAGVLCSTSWAT